MTSSRYRSCPLILALVLTLFLLVAGALLAPCSAVAAQPTFLDIPNRNDVCFDAGRDVLYISAGSQVLRYDVNTRSYLEPFDLGGQLRGMDISPDGSTLAVADGAYEGALTPWPPVTGAEDTNHEFLVDLDTGATETVLFQREWGEAGTWMVAWDAEGRLLSTSSCPGYGDSPLRRYDPESDVVEEIGSLSQKTALCPSGDRETIAYVQATNSGGYWGEYDSESGELYAGDSVSAFLYDAAVNQDGSQFAIPADTTKIFDDGLSQMYDAGASIGAKYSPSSDTLFLPIPGTTEVRAYETNKWKLRKTYDTEHTFGAYGSRLTDADTFGWPRMAIADGDRFFAVTVAGGVEVFDSRMQVSGQIASAAGGAGIPTAQVEVWRQKAGSWAVETTVTADWTGAFSYETTDTAPMKLRAYDPTGGHGPVWFGGHDLASAAFVVASSSATADFTLPFVRGATLSGVVRDTHGSPLRGIKATAWSDDSTEAPRETTSASDGSFQFANLPPGDYYLVYYDPAHIWETRYSLLADDFDDAQPVTVQGVGTTATSVSLERHVSVLELSPPEPAPGTALADLGDELRASTAKMISLQTTCNDASVDGRLMSGMGVKLQISGNGSLWSDAGAAVTNPAPGVYRATFGAPAGRLQYYRFAVANSQYVEGTASDSCALRFMYPTYWSGPASVAGTYSAAPQPGETTAVTGELLRWDGSPALGRAMVLQASADGGKTWWKSRVPVTVESGRYIARFRPVQALSYRLATIATPGEPGAVSGAVAIRASGTTGGGWSSWGVGPKRSAYCSADYSKPSSVSGESTTYPSADLDVQALVSADAVDYAPSGFAISRIAVPTNGGTAARYTATVPSVRSLGFYVLVMRGKNGNGPTTPRVTSPAWITPNAILTMSAPKKARARKSFTVSGQVLPQVVSPGTIVSVLYRKSGSKSLRTYKKYGVAGKGGRRSYSVKMKLPKGIYYIQCKIGGGAAWPTGPGVGPICEWVGSRTSPVKRVVIR